MSNDFQEITAAAGAALTGGKIGYFPFLIELYHLDLPPIVIPVITS
jgi:hypothetical protein